MVMFVSVILTLARDVHEMIRSLDFASRLYEIGRKEFPGGAQSIM